MLHFLYTPQILHSLHSNNNLLWRIDFSARWSVSQSFIRGLLLNLRYFVKCIVHSYSEVSSTPAIITYNFCQNTNAQNNVSVVVHKWNKTYSANILTLAPTMIFLFVTSTMSPAVPAFPIIIIPSTPSTWWALWWLAWWLGTFGAGTTPVIIPWRFPSKFPCRRFFHKDQNQQERDDSRRKEIHLIE